MNKLYEDANKHRSSGSALKCFVMWLGTLLWKAIKWLIPSLVVIFAIGFAVVWGGLFHREFEIVKGLVSWFAIWAAIDFHGWARREW